MSQTLKLEILARIDEVKDAILAKPSRSPKRDGEALRELDAYRAEIEAAK